MARIVSLFTKLIPRWGSHGNAEEFASLYKKPINPKIVLYGAHNKLFSDVLKRTFSQEYKVFTFESLLTENKLPKEVSSVGTLEAIARSITTVDSSFNEGYVIENFPSTKDQANQLDLLVDGINLALLIKTNEAVKAKLKDNYLECKTCGNLFNTALQSTFPQQPGTSEKCDTPTKCNIVKVEKDLTSAIEYEAKYQPVLEYYEKTGSLLTFEIDENWTYEETVSKLSDAIVAHIKL